MTISMDRPLLSICCLAFNHVNFIRDAIESFLMQKTNFYFEIIIHDDASTDFGPEAIAALLTEMSDGSGDIAIMVAGYPKEMKAMINSNPGLKSRFRNYYHFDDYTPNELVEIAK